MHQKKKKTRCIDCQINLLSSLYTAHMIEVHNLDPEILDFYCPLCHRQYAERHRFRQYLRDSHDMDFPSMKPRQNPDIIPSPSDPSFHCKSCDRHYKSLKVYKRHLRDAHPMVNLSPIKNSTRPANPNPNIQPLP
jgi:uncharacterized C2H2 Zn-finger protein